MSNPSTSTSAAGQKDPLSESQRQEVPSPSNSFRNNLIKQLKTSRVSTLLKRTDDTDAQAETAAKLPAKGHYTSMELLNSRKLTTKGVAALRDTPVDEEPLQDAERPSKGMPSKLPSGDALSEPTAAVSPKPTKTTGELKREYRASMMNLNKVFSGSTTKERPISPEPSSSAKSTPSTADTSSPYKPSPMSDTASPNKGAIDNSALNLGAIRKKHISYALSALPGSNKAMSNPLMHKEDHSLRPFKEWYAELLHGIPSN
jgi:hypothetical protein